MSLSNGLRRTGAATRITALVSLILAALLLAVGSASAQQDTFLNGDGHDGNVNINSGTVHYPNALAPVVGSVNAGDTSLVRGTVTAGSGTGAVTFAPGRLVLVLQTTGWAGATSSGDQSAVDMSGSGVGKWEFARIDSISGGNTFNFLVPLINSYPNATTQVVAVPEYDNYTITGNRQASARAWNGSVGGVVAVLAQSTLHMTAANSRLQADGVGFRGAMSYDENNATAITNCPTTLMDGQTDGVPDYPAGMKGEGIYPTAFKATTPATAFVQEGRGNYLNGGGGGNCFNAGGGGGGNGGTGGRGGNTLINYTNGNRINGGLGGAPLTYNASERAVFGGGGGAGERNDNGDGRGGTGGGFVLARANSITGSGTLRANATAGRAGNLDGTPYDGAGGGGAGGVVLVRSTTGAACTAVQALGAVGGNNASWASYDWTPGGGGAGGRTYIQKNSGTCAGTVTGASNGTNGGNAYGATAGTNGVAVADNTPFAQPSVTLSQPANGSFVTTTTPTISGTATANSTVSILIDNDGPAVGTALADGSGNWTFSSPVLSQGSHDVYVYSTLNGVSSPDSPTHTFIVDSIAPAINITAPSPGDYIATSTATVNFNITEANPGTTECSVDGIGWTSCSSGWVSPGMTEGPHTLQVRQTDLAGNAGSSSVAITVDLTNPVVNITGPGAGQYINDSSPDVTFNVAEVNPDFSRCRVDGGSWVNPCNSIWTITGPLSEGSHTIEIEHTDLAGRTGSSSRAFYVDTTAPETTIDTMPNAVTSSTDADFTFSSDESPVTYDCNLDSGGWNACTDTESFSGLSEGSHNLLVRATDAAGNTDATPASWTWVVDLTPPSVTISVPADDSRTNNETVTPAGTTTGAEDGRTVTVTVTGPDGFSANCTAVVSGGAWTCDDAIELDADGDYTFTANVSDTAGNAATPAVSELELDNAGYSLTIDGPVNNSTTNDDTPPINGQSDAPEGTEVVVTIDDPDNPGNPLVICTPNPTVQNDGSWSCVADVALPDGLIEITATVEDDLDNSTSATTNLNVDTLPPDLDVTGPTNPVATTTPTITGTTDQPVGSTVVVKKGVDTLCTATVVSGNPDNTWSCAVPANKPLVEGPNQLTVETTDAANNTTTRNHTVTVELAPAEYQISISGPSGTITSNKPAITGTSTAPAGSEVVVTIDNPSSPGSPLVICTPNAVVQSDGTWSCNSSVALPNGSVVITATVGAGGSSARTATVSVIVSDSSADPIACLKTGITIIDLSPKGKTATMRGFARSSYAGQTVSVRGKLEGKNKVLGHATVGSDGSFTVKFKAPAKKLWNTNKALYSATVGSESTRMTKLMRRVRSTTVTYKDGTLSVKGDLIKPLMPKAKAKVEARTGCSGKMTAIGSTTVKKNGTFSTKIKYQASGVVWVRVATEVSKGGKKPKALRTYSYLIPVILGD